MNIENYVCSLELAKQLKSEGYPQEDSLFYRGVKSGKIYLYETAIEIKYNPSFFYAAPISDELLEELPKEITLGKEKYEDFATMTIYLFEEGNHIFYDGENGEYFECKQDRFVDSVAELWLKLKKEGYL